MPKLFWTPLATMLASVYLLSPTRAQAQDLPPREPRRMDQPMRSADLRELPRDARSASGGETGSQLKRTAVDFPGKPGPLPLGRAGESPDGSAGGSRDDEPNPAAATDQSAGPTDRAGEGTSLALSPQHGGTDAGAPASTSGTLFTTFASLLVVLGLFLVVAWLLRRAGPKRTGRLPAGIFEVLGQAPLAARQQVHLLRLGSKLLLVSVTPTGAETLTEIIDPLEVDRIAGICKQADPQSASATFRQILGQFATERGSNPSGAGAAAVENKHV